MSPEARERSFDELARGLANGNVSRGKALRLMGGALLGSLLASIPGVAQAAQCPPGFKRCPTQSSAPPVGCCPEESICCGDNCCNPLSAVCCKGVARFGGRPVCLLPDECTALGGHAIRRS
jgi:hypothetical protein